MTIDECTRTVHAVCTARDWDQFHAPKNLAIGIATEAAELHNHFRFVADEASAEFLKDPTQRAEVADVFFFLLRFADRAGINRAGALHTTMAKNTARYPVEQSRGKSTKYTEL